MGSGQWVVYLQVQWNAHVVLSLSAEALDELHQGFFAEYGLRTKGALGLVPAFYRIGFDLFGIFKIIVIELIIFISK